MKTHSRETRWVAFREVPIEGEVYLATCPDNALIQATNRHGPAVTRVQSLASYEASRDELAGRRLDLEPRKRKRRAG